MQRLAVTGWKPILHYFSAFDVKELPGCIERQSVGFCDVISGRDWHAVRSGGVLTDSVA